MGKFVEILAMSLGGLSLFAVCFLGFAITSGKTLGEVPLIGALLESDMEAEQPVELLSPAEQIPTSTRPKSDIVEHSAGVLQTFSVASPYSQRELKELADEVKDTKLRLDRRLEEVDAESVELSLRNEALDDRELKIKDLQTEYEARMAELLLRESELRRDEAVAEETEHQVYVNKASSMAGLETQKAVTLLASYKVEEVAKILHAMDDKSSKEIIKALPEDRWTEVVDRLSRLQAEFPKRPK